jgi:hypothetical protein
MERQVAACDGHPRIPYGCDPRAADSAHSNEPGPYPRNHARIGCSPPIGARRQRDGRDFRRCAGGGAPRYCAVWALRLTRDDANPVPQRTAGYGARQLRRAVEHGRHPDDRASGYVPGCGKTGEKHVRALLQTSAAVPLERYGDRLPKNGQMNGARMSGLPAARAVRHRLFPENRAADSPASWIVPVSQGAHLPLPSVLLQPDKGLRMLFRVVFVGMIALQVDSRVVLARLPQPLRVISTGLSRAPGRSVGILCAAN